MELQEDILENLPYKAVLAYVAVLRRGAGTWSTPQLADRVGCETERMREGLEQLAIRHPDMAVRVSKVKWLIGGDRREAVQILDSEDRRKFFLDDLKAIWEWANKEQKFTMCPADGNAVKQFLKQHSDWNSHEWRTALRNRFKSEENHAQPLYRWLRRLPEYLNSPLDRYGKPMLHGGGELGKAVSREESSSTARQAVLGGAYRS